MLCWQRENQFSLENKQLTKFTYQIFQTKNKSSIMPNKIVVEIICSPVGVGVSVSKYVKLAVKAIEAYPDIRVMHHPMGTVFEADTMDQVLEVTKLAHEAIFEAGVQRVITQVRIDDRRDKERTMEDKVKALE